MRKKQKFSPGIKTVAELKKDPAYKGYLGHLNKEKKAEYEDLLNRGFPNGNIEGFDFSKNHEIKVLREFVEKKARNDTSSTQPIVEVNTKETIDKASQKTLGEEASFFKNSSKNLFGETEKDIKILEKQNALNPFIKNVNEISGQDLNIATNNQSKTFIENKIDIEKLSDTAFKSVKNKAVDLSTAREPTFIPNLNQVLDKNYKPPKIEQKENINNSSIKSVNNSSNPKLYSKIDKKIPFQYTAEERQQFLIDFAEADKNVNYPTPTSEEIKGNERLKKFYANLKAEQKTEEFINKRRKTDAQLNSPEAKAARAAAAANGEERLENLYKETGFVPPNSSRNTYSDATRSKDLETRLTAIENNENVKKTLNFTTRSDGSMSYSSKKDYEAAQKFINEQEAEYVKTYLDGFKNDAKYKLDEKISSFVNNKNWEKEFSGMGAQQKAGLMSNLTEAQINMVKKKGLDLENIANWSEEQMGSVVKGLKEAEYMNDIRENLTREFREGVNQRANLAGYNKIASRESSVASEMSKKMSGFKSVGKLAIGGALMYGLISALSDSGGQQSNAQLYGQQPLY